jgi:hypothetical protein
MNKLDGISKILNEFRPKGYTESEMDTAVKELAESLLGQVQLYQPAVWRDGLNYFVVEMPDDLDPETGRPLGLSENSVCIWG